MAGSTMEVAQVVAEEIARSGAQVEVLPISEVEGVTLMVDDELPKPPVNEGQLNFRERYARPSKYLAPILRVTRPVKPVSIGVFGGRLEYGRLKWWAVLFAMLVIQAPAGSRTHMASNPRVVGFQPILSISL